MLCYSEEESDKMASSSSYKTIRDPTRRGLSYGQLHSYSAATTTSGSNTITSNSSSNSNTNDKGGHRYSNSKLLSSSTSSLGGGGGRGEKTTSFRSSSQEIPVPLSVALPAQQAYGDNLSSNYSEGGGSRLAASFSYGDIRSSTSSTAIAAVVTPAESSRTSNKGESNQGFSSSSSSGGRSSNNYNNEHINSSSHGYGEDVAGGESYKHFLDRAEANNRNSKYSPTNIRTTDLSFDGVRAYLSSPSKLDSAGDLKREVERLQGRLSRSERLLEEYQTKTEILEDLIQYRSDELNLSGHAELLSKLFSVRNDVATLRKEVSGGNSNSDGENDNGNVSGSTVSPEKLQRQIAAMKTRISNSEKDLIIYNSKNIEAELQETVHERDVLLHFVKDDVEKSAGFAKQLEVLESKYKSLHVEYLSLQRKQSRTEQSLEDSNKRHQLAQKSSDSYSIKVPHLERENDVLKNENSQLSNEIVAKNKELNELYSDLDKITSRSRDNEESNLRLSYENKTNASKLQSLQYDVSRLQSENDLLKHACKEYEDKVHSMRATVDTVSPRLAQVEPELMILRSEKLNWLQERNSLLSDLENSNSTNQSFRQFMTDLQISLPTRTTNSMISSSPSKQQSEISPSKKSSFTMAANNVDSLQAKVYWTSLPSLKQFSPFLSDQIQGLVRALHDLNSQCSSLKIKEASLNNELESFRARYRDEIGRLSRANEMTNSMLDDKRSQLASTESEALHHQGASIILSSIQQVIRAYPGGLKAVLARSNSSHLIRPSHNKNDTLSSSTSNDGGDEGSSSSSSSSSVSDSIDIPDHLLPDVLAQALLHNSTAVENLSHSVNTIEALHLQISSLQLKLKDALSENDLLRNKIEEMNKAILAQKEIFFIAERKLNTDVENAVDLTEKQNALVITLEAKLESAKRQNVVQTAMVAALRQQEETLLSYFKRVICENDALIAFSEVQTMTPSQESSSFDKCIEFCSQVFLALNTKLQDQIMSPMYQYQQMHQNARNYPNSNNNNDNSIYNNNISINNSKSNSSNNSKISSSSSSNSPLFDHTPGKDGKRQPPSPVSLTSTSTSRFQTGEFSSTSTGKTRSRGSPAGVSASGNKAPTSSYGGSRSLFSPNPNPFPSPGVDQGHTRTHVGSPGVRHSSLSYNDAISSVDDLMKLSKSLNLVKKNDEQSSFGHKNNSDDGTGRGRGELELDVDEGYNDNDSNSNLINIATSSERLERAQKAYSSVRNSISE